MKKTLNFDCIKGKVYFGKQEVGTYDKNGFITLYKPITKTNLLSPLEKIFCKKIIYIFCYKKELL